VEEELWKIELSALSGDLQNDTNITIDDKLKINVDLHGNIEEIIEIEKDKPLHYYLKNSITNNSGHMVRRFYKVTEAIKSGGYINGDSLNGKVTIKINDQEYSKEVSELLFGDLKVSDILEDSNLSGEGEIIFEVVNSPIPIQAYKMNVSIK
jgi:hypothetical protein